MSKVDVKIYNQVYTIAGDYSEEVIRKIAEHVDEQMNIIGKAGLDNTNGSVALLTEQQGERERTPRQNQRRCGEDEGAA